MCFKILIINYMIMIPNKIEAMSIMQHHTHHANIDFDFMSANQFSDSIYMMPSTFPNKHLFNYIDFCLEMKMINTLQFITRFVSLNNPK